MAVKQNAAGRRLVELSIEVPGTPEQVWRAIATGPGVSAWFTPTEIEEREGGAIAFHLGPDDASYGRVTVWAPPHRFAFEERDWLPGAPPLASEFVIEPGEGGCTVRLVHSLFASDEDWDDQLESMEKGWPPLFQVLRLYLDGHADQPAASVRAMGAHAGDPAAAWADFTAALGLAPVPAGERCAATARDAPTLEGEAMPKGRSGVDTDLLLRLDAPAPGAAQIGAFEWGGRSHVMVGLYLFGADAAEIAAREETIWTDWMAERFPPTPSEESD